MTDPDLGWTDLGVRPDVSGFGRDLDRQLGTQMTTSGRAAASRFSAGFKRAAVLGAAGAGALAVKVVGDSIDQASTLNESLNAVNVTYKRQAEAVKALGEQSADSLGLSNSEFNKYSVQFSGFVDQIANRRGEVAGVLDDLTTRGADFASVMDLEVSDALGKFQSGLAGETEPLRQYGINLAAARVEAYALAEGIQKQGTEFTEAEKVQARYALLMKETKDTQGDFARTSGDLANSQRRLNANWSDAQAELGTALLPVMTKVTNYLADEGVPAFERASDFFVNDFAPAVGDLAADMKPLVSATGDLVGFLKGLPSEAKLAGVIGLVGAMGAAKLRGGSGALGAAGSALGLAKPVPVLVTNPGFGTGRGGSPVVTPDGKTKGTGARNLAKGAGVLALLSLAGDDTNKVLSDPIGQFIKEVTWPWTDGPFSGKGGSSGGSTSGLRDLLGAPMGLDYDPTLKQLLGGPLGKGYEEDVERLTGKTKLFGDAIRDIPGKRQTMFEIFGYDLQIDRARRLGRELDRAARPREARITITKEYADAGYETRGGIQRGGGTKTTQSGRSVAGGGLP